MHFETNIVYSIYSPYLLCTFCSGIVAIRLYLINFTGALVVNSCRNRNQQGQTARIYTNGTSFSH